MSHVPEDEEVLKQIVGDIVTGTVRKYFVKAVIGSIALSFAFGAWLTDTTGKLIESKREYEELKTWRAAKELLDNEQNQRLHDIEKSNGVTYRSPYHFP